jgi:hypothetical protein
VPLVYQPLCWRPSVCDSNHCGTMSRWSHVNLRSGLVPSIFGCARRLSRPSSSRRRSWVPRTSPNPPGEPGSAGVDAALALDELVQRLGIRLVHGRVAHHPGPLASALAGSAVHRMIAANGSSRSDTSNRCKRRARRARSTSRPSAVHQATRPYTAVRYPDDVGNLMTGAGRQAAVQCADHPEGKRLIKPERIADRECKLPDFEIGGTADSDRLSKQVLP